ncbi:MAG TPA: linear amide C-N hydrolase [Pyrinomonadaceae bacterium]|nr:linear amide C-N hydrolase [Pyrinomonadaceae bacterium]
MKRICLAVAFALVFVFSLHHVSLACTTFCLKRNGEVLFGKNYDWMVGDGLVYVNKRGVAKSAVSEGGPNPARWVSQYGSVTFNQYGRENPSGGMNETGLVIELMWHADAQYPKADARPMVGTLEWVQYQLDSSCTVTDVINNSEKIRISSDIPLHYLVSDKAGNTATIEFLEGKLLAHVGKTLPMSALTNDSYEKSVKYALATPLERAKTSGSLDRFARAAQRTAAFEREAKTEQDAVNYAFETLSNVAQPGYTQWSIVYDQKRGKIYFRTLQSPQIKMIDTAAFDYSCASAVKMFDANSKESGEVTAKFADYARGANRSLIERSYDGTDFLKRVPAPERDAAAAYPETFPCKARS